MTAQDTPAEYTGTLRPRITFLGPVEVQKQIEGQAVSETYHHFKVEWIEGTNVSKVIWTEEIKVPKDYSFVPQIAGYGTFTKQGGFYVDEDNLRHFVMDAQVGLFGQAPGQVELHKG